ncbi:MAG: hypothetical protein CBD94_01865 [Gammaproteobacteria bacterium TMED234]|jgi:hypothetical protein|nr:MAG: hypothetical protein CBD94_01865 [Gammaproteobacteria bacterium TMED234]|tara:strand:- start:20016 stop:20252 length:237 start_codon:yes stop_codon:yes gene_type:complete
MNTQRNRELKERDVRRDAPEQNPVDFMHRYILSNFPQTSAIPSKEQKESMLPMNTQDNGLKLMKKPLSGTSFDNPAGS